MPKFCKPKYRWVYIKEGYNISFYKTTYKDLQFYKVYNFESVKFFKYLYTYIIRNNVLLNIFSGGTLKSLYRKINSRVE